MPSKMFSKPILKYPPEFKTYLLLYIYFSFVGFIQILVSIPFAIFRLLVIIYIKSLVTDRKEYGNILNSFCTSFADDQFTTNPTNSSIVTVLELEGKLTLEKLRVVIKSTLAMKIKGSSEDRYKKLRQYPQSVMGYWFWKNELKFNLDEHLNVLQFTDLSSDTNVDTTETVTKLHGIFLNKTFPEKRSPWYFTLIENVPYSTKQESPKTLLVLRIHHSLADGISTLKFIVEGLGQTKANTSESSRPAAKSSIFHRIQYILKILVYLFPKMVGSAVNNYIFHQMTLNHPWRHSNLYNKSVPSFAQFSKEIPVNMLKLKSSISPSAVIITALTESIRKFLNRSQQNSDHVIFSTTLPKPMHPSFPTTHVNMGTIITPDFGGNFFQALKHAETMYMSQRDDDIHHLMTAFGSNLFAVKPYSFRLAVQPGCPFVTVASNLAGNNVEFSIADLPCKSFSLSASQGNTAAGVAVTIFSYKKLVRFCVMAKENILTKEESRNLADLITEQIYYMNKKILTHSKAD